jgi:MSHA biogenesis protein MshM
VENGRLLRHFGLLSEPFRVSPRRRDFFPPDEEPPGVDALVGARPDRARLVVVSGEHGTGRTSALRRIATTLKHSGWLVFTVEMATAPHPEHLSDEDILLAACRNFGLFRALTEHKPEAAAEALRAHASTRPDPATIAIAVDDADRLADTALAGLLRLVADVPAEARCGAGGVALVGGEAPGLALLLSGPPDFRRRLDAIRPSGGGPVWRDGEAVELALWPMSAEEVRAYVEYCLEVAGSPTSSLFDAAALDKLSKLSRGVLSEVNAIAAQGLIFAWQTSQRTITAELIEPPGALLPTAAATTPGLPVPSGARAVGEARRGWRHPRLLWSVPAGLLALGVLAGTLLWPGQRELADEGARLWHNLVALAAPQSAVPGVETQLEPAQTNATDLERAARSQATVGGDGMDRPGDLASSAGPVGEATADFLIARGEVLLRGADAVSARRFFARAVETGSAIAATAMAASYDPLYLESAAIRGVESDADQAAAWYRIAIARGDVTAHERLDALLAAKSAKPSAEP